MIGVATYPGLRFAPNGLTLYPFSDSSLLFSLWPGEMVEPLLLAKSETAMMGLARSRVLGWKAGANRFGRLNLSDSEIISARSPFPYIPYLR
jgi:hypothetical protein